MKAYLFFDVKLSKQTIKRIELIDKTSLVIVSDKAVYHELINSFPEKKIEFIDVFSNDNAEEKIQLTNEVIQKFLQGNPNLCLEGYDIPYLTINTIFDNFLSIIYNAITEVDNLIEKYGISNLVLYDGNPSVQFIAITLSEGERPGRFLYKRSWYLNYFINSAFNGAINIIWERKYPATLLRIFYKFRSFAVFFVKFLMILKRKIKEKQQSKVSHLLKFKGNIEGKNSYAVLPVRNPIQVGPLIPIYNTLKRENKIQPIYLAFENYSNNSLNQTLDNRGLFYFDLYNLLTFKKIINLYKDFFNLKNKSLDDVIEINIKGHNVKFQSCRIIKELSIYWIDIFIFRKLLDDFSKLLNKNIKCLINNETDWYHSALEATWAKKRNILTVGVQHVAIATRLKPRISWVDNMFMLSRDTANALTELKPNEKFTYVGPVAYDEYFNTSKHEDNFKIISIFTQPDDFKNEYIRIIEDLIEIIKKNKLSFDIKIKLHPREKDIKTFIKFKDIYANIEVLTDEMESSSLIAESDLVLSIHSGTLMQAIIIGTPSISINYEKKYDIKFDFILDDVTTKIYSKLELEEQINNLFQLNKNYFYKRKNYLKYKLEDYEGNAATKIYNFIKEAKV